MTHVLMRDFHANAAQLGRLSSAFFLSYALFQIPASLLIHRFGARKTLTIVAVLCAIGSLLFGLAPNIETAFFARFLIGLAGAFAFTAVLYLIIRWMPGFYFALFAGITQLIGALGAIGGEAPLTELINHFGWHHTMMIFAGIGLLIAGITALALRDRPSHFVENQTKTNSNTWIVLKTIFKNPQMWAIFIYGFMIWSPVITFAALWGDPFLQLESHLSDLQAANMIALLWVGIAIASPLVGWISDTIKRRVLPLALLALIGLFAFIPLLCFNNLSQEIIALLMLLIGFSAAGQTLIFAVVKDINTTQTSTVAIGANNMAIVVSGVLLQPLVGTVLDWTWMGKIVNGAPFYTVYNYRIALLTLPVCLLIAFITATFFLKETHCQSLE